MALFLKNLVFTLVAPGMVAVFLPFILTRGESIATNGLLFVAIGMFVLGGAIYCWCVWDFATFGKGTPAPIDEPKKLVVRGLYRHVRNPMYFGVLAVIFAWAVLYRSVTVLGYGFFMALIFHLFVLFYEERHLRLLYGREYEDYCTHVSRWFPRLRKALP